MTKILFVCHGNICRSPMAEFVMKDMAQKAGVSATLQIASAATSTEEIGNGVYPPVRRLLAAQGIDCTAKRARQLTKADYAAYDYLVGMDEANRRNMQRICGGDPEGKISLLLEFARRGDAIADPWYSGDFETTWNDVQQGCTALLAQILQQ